MTIQEKIKKIQNRIKVKTIINRMVKFAESVKGEKNKITGRWELWTLSNETMTDYKITLHLNGETKEPQFIDFEDYDYDEPYRCFHIVDVINDDCFERYESIEELIKFVEEDDQLRLLLLNK